MHFIFIVFNDPQVVGVINFLQDALGGRGARTSPHLTIQGPLPDRPTRALIEHIERTLQNDEILIANPGLFETRSGAAVFLRVESQNLKKVWNKPDFPIEKHGFNPHITLYDGPDIELAKRAHDFLRSGRHRVELICREFAIVPYVSKQVEMFPMTGALGDEHAVSRLVASGKVSTSFRAAFLQAVARH